MTEQEYIDATNLTKLRTAQTILRDCLFLDEKDENDASISRQRIAELIDKLEKKVRTKNT